ncbi:MAG: AAA family ATPase, partial [Firmicutes bacterium]|nr:AAA family ATPase [Bacillota bacterium]
KNDGEHQTVLELEKNGHHPVFVTYTKELVREVRKRLFEETNTNFDSCVMTLKDFLLKKNNKDENSVFYYDHSYFKQWLETTKQYWHGGSAKLRAIDSSVAWTYIRGIVKGFVDSASSSPMLSEKAFIKEAKNEDLDLALAQGIYQVAKDFSMHIAAEEKKNDSPYADDNDLAFLLTKKDKIKTEECLIIDEAQDLTFIQVQALIRCVKNNAIYFCGDVNQRINPTIVDLDRFGAYFFNSNTKLSTFELSNTFRCSEGITRFLNHLADLRRTYVAKQDAKNEVKICTSRPPDEGLWATVCESGKKDLFNVLALACNKANCIIIVPNQKRKDELTSIMPENETRIQTITEAKGLEYDNVLIYDFVTENAAEFEKIFSNTHSRNTFDRLLFNMFYVAGTRARERLIILEEKISETIKNRLFLNVYFDQSTKSVSRFLDIDDDIKGWLEEAVRQEELEDFRSAIHSYERAGKQVYAKDIKRCMLLKEEDDLCKAGPISLAVKSHISCAERLTEAQEFKHAFFIYQKIINTCDPGFSSYGYLLSKQMMTKIITKQDISNQMASYGKSDELITNHRQNYIKLIDNSIIINKEIIDNIALSLKK